jgi:hypothetical protein
MALNVTQFEAELENLGVDEVRMKLAQGVYNRQKTRVAEAWLKQKESAGSAESAPSVPSEHPYWRAAGRAAVVITIFGAVIGGSMRLGQSDFGYQILGRNPPNNSPVPSTLTDPPLNSEQAAAPVVIEVGPRPRGLFEPGNPFPWPFTNFKIGTRMSVLLAAFPDARRDYRSLSISFPEGPFDHAYYSFDDDRIDPVVLDVSFSVGYTDIVEGIRDEEAIAEVSREVLAAFQQYPYEQSRVNDTIYWDDVNGYNLRLSAGYWRVEEAD